MAKTAPISSCLHPKTKKELSSPPEPPFDPLFGSCPSSGGCSGRSSGVRGGWSTHLTSSCLTHLRWMQGPEGTGVCDVQQRRRQLKNCCKEKFCKYSKVIYHTTLYAWVIFYHSVFKPFVCLYSLSRHPSWFPMCPHLFCDLEVLCWPPKSTRFKSSF